MEDFINKNSERPPFGLKNFNNRNFERRNGSVKVITD